MQKINNYLNNIHNKLYLCVYTFDKLYYKNNRYERIGLKTNGLHFVENNNSFILLSELGNMT